MKNKIKYLIIFIFLTNCNLVAGTSDALKKVSEGAGTFSEGVFKAGEGVVTMSQGILPIADGMYQDAVDIGRFLLRD